MLNDKPLRAADSRTARQTISQAAKIGRQQAAVSICLCHEQNMLSNKPSTMNTLRRELYAKQLAIRQACALRHRLPSRCLLPAMPGERRESRYGAIWDAKRLATVSTAANLMSWRHRAAHSASHGMLAHRPHVVAMLVATRRLAGAGIALMSVLARRWHGFARHWRAADMTVASCVPCRPYGMCASCAFPGRGARRAPVTVECGMAHRALRDGARRVASCQRGMAIADTVRPVNA